jgi:IS605 OrfB family transposase
MKCKTLKVRVRDKHIPDLLEMAKSVNCVWNYCNELSSNNIKKRGKFLSNFDMHKYTTGSNKELGLHSQTIQCISKEYVTRRNQFKKSILKWRSSHESRKSLGWIPINTKASSFRSGQIFHNKKYYKIWDSFGLSKCIFKTASFNEDARGRWYFNVVVEVNTEKSKGTGSLGIDLGCKETAVDSNEDGIKGREYRKLEQKLKIAQRAKKKNRTKAIHAKIKNRRKDTMHKYTTNIVAQNAAIFVGNISSKKLIKTKMAKSVLDAGWSMLKTILEYKCDYAGVVFEVINEAYTTQICSDCGVISDNSPKGRADLGIREWTCECGNIHSCVNDTAKNILVAGHCHLAGGIPSL